MANNNDNRGFAKIAEEDPQKMHDIAAKGGRAAHESGNAHEFSSEEAREAGSKSHQND